NGVVIITTKSPQGGKTTVSYNGWVQVKTLPKELSVLSPYEFALLQYELASLRGSTALSSYNNYFGVWGDIDIYKNLQGTDWQKQMFGQNTFSQSHNISVMGGTQTTKYNVSVTRTDDPGLMVGTGYKRTNLNFRLSHDLSKPLTVELGARLSDTEVDGAGTANSNSSTKVRSAVTYRPVNGLADFIPVDVEDLSNQLDLTSGLADPVTLANQSYEKQPRFSLNLNSAVSWRITPNLTFRSDFGVDYNYNKDNRFYGPLTTTAKNNGNLPLAQIISTTNPGYRWANTFTYNVTGLGEKHDLNMLLGQEMLSEYTSTITSTSRMFPADIAPEKALALMTLGSQEYTGTTTTPNERLASYFGRANYTFMKRYLITFTLRADGSSKFAPGKQWGYFPAAAIAWRLSDESFMKSYDFISALKVRASLGEAGNNRIPDDSYRQTYKLDSSKPIEFNEVQQPYYDPASTILYNPDLKWETTITRNVGLDFGLFKNRVNGTMDLYWNTTKDLIVQSTVPSYLGYSTQFRNIGQTSNRGIEITVNGVAVNTKDFTLSASFNIGMNRSRIDKLDGVNSKPITSGWASTDLREVDDFVLQVGQPVGLIYGYVADGMYKIDDFNYDPVKKTYTLKPGIPDDRNIISAVNFGPGSLKLKKLSPDTSVVISPDKDRKVIGNTNPLSSGGFNITSTYKGFDLTLFFNWVYGDKVYNANKIDFTSYWNRQYTNYLSTVDYAHRYKYIDGSGNIVTDPVALADLNKNATMWSPLMGRPVVTSLAVEDGSFLRLNNVTLGYSLPKKLISKVHMTQFRLYCTIYNAWLLTNYTGYDPEVNTIRTTSLTPNVDYNAYPKARSYTVGVNVTF
ncbi:MAG TPA: SusC/RagA family TonB-linked outer membrane protein, partial [Bacteroidales bacterium]